MINYIVKRLFMVIPILIIASIVIFLLIHIAPGGPVRTMLGPRQTAELVAQIRHQLGLDLPLHRQYLIWAGKVLHGDLGISIGVQPGANVASLIVQRYSVTLEVTFLAMIVSLLIAFPAGIISSLRQNRLSDHIARIIALLGISIPVFFTAIILIMIFGVYLSKPWGAGGFVPLRENIGGNLIRLLLPVITLGSAYSPLIMRMMRSTMLDVIRQEYVRTARAMGISRTSIVKRDIIRNAMIPVITVIGNSIGYLVGGSIITETVFRLPGVGNLIVNAVFRRDYAVIQGIVLVIVVSMILINLVVDILYAYLDPRIRYGRMK